MMTPLVVITRPQAQAEPLLRALDEAGIRTVHQPTLRILPVADPDGLCRYLENRCGEYGLALFVSINAVQQAAQLVDLARWLQGKQVFAVGHATRSWLQRQGVESVHAPRSRQTSEGLLALSELQHPAGNGVERRAILFNAAGGRQLLLDTLTERGFRVEEAQVYRRQPETGLRPELRQALIQRQPLLLTATSSAMLDALLNLCSPEWRDHLLDQTLIVVSPRMAHHAHSLGFNRVFQAQGASNEQLMEAIKRQQDHKFTSP